MRILGLEVRCPACDLDFNPIDFSLHWIEEHPNLYKSNVCPFCDGDAPGFLKHMLDWHASQASLPRGSPKRTIGGPSSKMPPLPRRNSHGAPHHQLPDSFLLPSSFGSSSHGVAQGSSSVMRESPPEWPSNDGPDGLGNSEDESFEVSCPYCLMDFKLSSFCNHWLEDHRSVSKEQVCPFCLDVDVQDLLVHVTRRHTKSPLPKGIRKSEYVDPSLKTPPRRRLPSNSHDIPPPAPSFHRSALRNSARGTRETSSATNSIAVDAYIDSFTAAEPQAVPELFLPQSRLSNFSRGFIAQGSSLVMRRDSPPERLGVGGSDGSENSEHESLVCLDGDDVKDLLAHITDRNSKSYSPFPIFNSEYVDHSHRTPNRHSNPFSSHDVSPVTPDSLPRSALRNSARETRKTSPTIPRAVEVYIDNLTPPKPRIDPSLTLTREERVRRVERATIRAAFVRRMLTSILFGDSEWNARI